jgi:LPS-assembly protein
MPKLLFLFSFFICFGLVYATENNQIKEKNKIEVNAKNINSTKTTVTGSDGVVVYYQDSVIQADKAFYDKESKILTLEGRVEMLGYKGTKEHTNRMTINTQTDEVNFEKLFFTNQNDIWLYTNKAKKSEGNYTLGNSVFSSCSVDDPIWKMAFERSVYNSKDEYMKVYNAKIYFKDVPIAYTPYLAFSTNNERSSGLLFPLLGYSSDDGFVYEQPIFWAIAANMDLELNPQVRTNRSVGAYATFRFVDTPHSSGKLRVGYFKDQEDYTLEHNFENSSHYGLEFNYESSKLFSDKLGANFRDGLYINSTFLNDIDYINLQKTSLTHFGVTPLQESRLNYFLHNNEYYAGINAKYFIDTRKDDNSDTLQILPSINLHKYLTSFLVDDLTYSVDMHINNYYRTEGSTQKQVEMRIPIEFTTSFFDDFINLSLGEELYYSKSFFGNGDYLYDNYQYYSNFHRAKIFTDLTKKYSSFTHVIQPSIEYFQPGSENEKPTQLSDIIENQPTTEPSLKDLPFSIGLPENSYYLSINQYFYDDKMKLKFYQRISQIYYSDREYRFSNITNEMGYNLDKWRFYSNITYSTEFSYLTESSSLVSFIDSEYNFALGHTFKQIADSTTQEPTYTTTANEMNFNFGYNYSEDIKFSGAATYNLDTSESKQWLLSGSYKQDCWSVMASMRQDITPRPTGSTLENKFFVQFNFIPFGTIGSGK